MLGAIASSDTIMHARKAHCECMQKDVPPPRFELGAKDRPEEISVIYYVI